MEAKTKRQEREARCRPARRTARRLVLVSCSAAKKHKPREAIPAIDRYDGVFYKVIRKALAEDRIRKAIRFAILSAKFGLIDSQTPIPCYDQKLDKHQAEALRPTVRRKLKRLLRTYAPQDIFVNLGRQYAVLVEDLPELDGATWAEGPIGKRAASLKSWLWAEEPR